MTDLRSLDSAPDSQFDFGELSHPKESHEDFMDPMELLKRDHEKQKKGLPPMFSGPTGSGAGIKISSEQFSLKNKASASAMSSLHSGPIRPNKIQSRPIVSKSPDKSEE